MDVNKVLMYKVLEKVKNLNKKEHERSSHSNLSLQSQHHPCLEAAAMMGWSQILKGPTEERHRYIASAHWPCLLPHRRYSVSSSYSLPISSSLLLSPPPSTSSPSFPVT